MKIIAYDDNPDYGGHQTMACLGVEALAADPSNEIVFFANPANEKLIEKLEAIDNCKIVESPCATRRPQGIRNLLAPRAINRLEALFKKYDADLLLCIQGDIEQSSQALLAARRIGLECVSYLALPHPMARMGAKLGTLRDWANRSLWNKPDRYITIAEEMSVLLRGHGTDRPVTVVYNGIPPPASPRRPHTAPFTLGLIGRLEFKQKQQDFMVESFCNHATAFKDCHLLLAGDGPDQQALQELIARCARSREITIQPWKRDLDGVFSTIDLLIIPSLYEGVPLVMLEALVRGIPVIGSNRDGMKDILPASWTFEPGNAAAMAATFAHVRVSWSSEIETVREKVLKEHSLDTFRNNFCKAVLNK